MVFPLVFFHELFYSVLFVSVFSSSALSAGNKPSLPTAEENDGVSLKGS
jgi:hypothetical protein